MVILDPDKDGTSIWFESKVSRIRGNVYECCDEIIERTCRKVGGNYRQEYPIAVDCTGIGRAHFDRLKSIGLEVFPIRAQSIDTFLPRLNDGG